MTESATHRRHSRTADVSSPWTLTCESLSIARGKRLVLHEINLRIQSGECVTLIGPNGSGKTTLLLALLGLLPPASGRVHVDGRDVGGLSARTRGRFLSYVPQTIERVQAFTVYDVVAAGRFPHVAALTPLSREDHEHVQRALEQCELTHLAERQVNEISGGERQKALIAAAIAQDAQAMLLDEPNTALDPRYQVELLSLLRRWHDSGRALVLVSHDLQLPAALGGRVFALRDGRIADDGSATELLSPDRLEAVYGTAFESVRTDTGRTLVMPRWWNGDALG